MFEIVSLILVLFACAGIYTYLGQMEATAHRREVGRQIERNPQNLQRRRCNFQELGNVVGMSLAEINENVGLPQSLSTVSNNVLFQCDLPPLFAHGIIRHFLTPLCWLRRPQPP